MCMIPKPNISSQKIAPLLNFNQRTSGALIATLFSQMNLNTGHRRVQNGYSNHSLGPIHRLIPKLRHRQKNVVVEDLSEALIPIIGNVKFAAVIHNLFSPQECRDLIDITEKRGYTNALIQGPDGNEILRQDIRNSGRCIIDDENLANAWFDRVVQALEGSAIQDKLFDAHWIENHEDRGRHRSLRAVGLNERLRFLRYHPGQYFEKHKDNSYKRGADFGPKAGEESHLTFILYLNDKMKGGQTRIENDGRLLDIVPETGSVLIFDHDILHEAIAISSGTKYCCRTDVMFAVNELTEEPAKLLPSENMWASRVKSVKSSRNIR